MSNAPNNDPLDVLIIGAGISGIGMAAHLRRKCRDKRFAIIERRANLGGTWDLFRYPGIRSDSDMFTLGYEFEPWRKDRSIAEGSEILGYLEDVAAKFGITEHIRFSTKALSADWDSAKGLWTVRKEGADGELSEMRARFLFVSAGYYDYDEPHQPQIPGIENFKGRTIHPQFWPEDADFTDKNVVVIGSGATGATLVPAMAERAAHVTMLQRTPSWYLAMASNDRLASVLRRFLPESWTYQLVRRFHMLMQQQFFRNSRRNPARVSSFLENQVRKKLPEKFNSADFTPPYGPWEQRMCMIPDGDLFEAMNSGKADIVTGEIAAVEQTGISLANGRHLSADIIVTATGLKLATLGKMVISLDGEPVHMPDHFYYRSCMFSNLPNFAALFGYLNAAWTARVDLVADYLCRLFNQMEAWQADIVTPVLPEDHSLVEADPLAGFSSGYLARGRHLIPKSSTSAPWQMRHDYLADRRDMREAPLDDGWLQFARASKQDAPVAASGHLS
ncbi:MAG: NAD(P)/FAD-dependent oxidoreductase [Novosphingobium sp.]|nr:NAD(P)/FAD-dependent oxidoreductase [Novosphingobium sp.]